MMSLLTKNITMQWVNRPSLLPNNYKFAHYSRSSQKSLKAMAHDEHNKPCRVAVIGAGAAGLVAARELKREGHQIVVFEQTDHVGGTWVYDPHVETDPLGQDSARTVVHNSMYLSLRTNLPREVMGFMDYPFRVVEGRDCRRFPGHKEVALYLQDFAEEFELLSFIRFRTEVEYVGKDPDNENQWIVRSNAEKRDLMEEVYDAVVVCNGHHTQPRVAEIPGIDKWAGKQIHSHNYRVPDPFQDQFEYDDWLADQCGCAPVEDWRRKIYTATSKNRASNPHTYRDKWDDNYWLEITPLDKQWLLDITAA